MPFPIVPPAEWAPVQIPGRLRDEFTGANGDIETPARTWLDWEAVTGSGAIASNQATGATVSGQDVFRCTTALGTADHSSAVEVTAVTDTAPQAASVWLRMGTGATLDGYEIRIDLDAATIAVLVWESDVSTDITGAFGPLAAPPTVPFTLRGSINNAALDVYVDDAVIWQGLDETASLTGNTAVGFGFIDGNSTALVTAWEAVELGSLLLTPGSIETTAAVGAPAFLAEAEQIPGLIAAWDAGDLALTDGTAVSSWSPYAGAQAAPLTATGTARPVFRTNRVNGQPAVVFTAASQQSMDTGAWSQTYPVPLTVIVVHRWTTLNAWMDLWSGRNYVYTHASARPARLTVGAGTAGQFDDPTSLSTTGWHIAGVVFNGAQTRTFYDAMTGTGTGTTGTGPAAALPGLVLGASSTRSGAWLNGEITRFLVIGRAVGDAEMAGILGDLAQEYALPWAPAPGEEGPPEPPIPGGTPAPAPFPEPTSVAGVPTPHLGIVVDSGPLEFLTLPSSGLGNYSTFGAPSITNLPGIIWGPSTTLAISTVAPQAGETHLAFTRTGTTGDASFILGVDFNTVDPSGRNFLIWAPTRPADGQANRTVRVSATWLDAAETTLGSDLVEQDEGTGYMTVEGYTWPGLRTTAPAGARHLVIGVLVEGCAVGETHYFDAWTIRYFGVNLGARLRQRPGETRGRSSDLSEFEAGKASWVLDNADGALTPGGTGLPVDLRQQITMLWELDGLLYPGGCWYTDEWTAIPHADGVGDIRVDCVDGFELLASVELLPPHQSEVIYLAVADTYLPLSEESGSRTAGNIAGAGGIAYLRQAAAGSGGSDFGGQSFEPVLSSGHTSDGDATCLQLNDGDLTGGKGDVLEVTGLPAAIPKKGQGWTFMARVAIPPETGGQYQVIYRNALESNLPYLPGFQIAADTTGRIEVSSYGAVVLTTTLGYDTGTPYSLAVTYDPTVGAYGRVRIRIYGSDVSATLTGDPWGVIGVPTRAYLGGTYTPVGANLTAPYRGRLSHVILAGRVLPDTTIAYLEQHISTGFLENETVRAVTICSYAGYAVAYTRLAAGQSVLLPAHWADGTSLLAALRATARHAAAQLMMSADGRVMSHSRLHRAAPAARTVFAGGELSPARAGLSPRFDRSRLANSIVASRPRGARYRLVDAQSKAKYGEVKAPAVELHVNSDQEVLDHARAVLRARATPRSEIKTVEFDLTGRPELAAALLRLELGDFITAGDLPDTSGVDQVSGFVDQIRSWSDGPLRAMRMRLSLSPASSALTYGDVPGQDPTTPPVPVPETPPPAEEDPDPPAAGGFWPSGGDQRSNSASQAGVLAWGTWRGKASTLAHTYNTRTNGWGSFMPNTGQPTSFTNPTLRLIILSSPFPINVGATWNALGAGSYNSQWAQFGSALKAFDESVGRPASIVCPAWECNGDYFAWGYGTGAMKFTTATQYINGFRQIYTSFKSTYPAGRVAWVMNGHTNPIAGLYPGDAYCDYIGVNYYDHYPASKTVAAFNAEANKAAAGVLWYLQMARDHGKKFIVPEWGLSWQPNATAASGGGDNPVYIEEMFKVWQNANSTGHMAGECYFNDPMGGNPPNVDSDLYANGNPKSAAKYLQLY